MRPTSSNPGGPIGLLLSLGPRHGPVWTLIRPVLAYGSETWTLTKSDKDILGVFERKILRAIFGPTNDNGEWRIKYNSELYAMYKENNIVTHQN